MCPLRVISCARLASKVETAEALQMGLVSRVLPPGHALACAHELARQLASFPQTCLRGDRMAAYEQSDLPLRQAPADEFRHGRASLEVDALQGAARFATGAGRHGKFED
jgi:enoyl-CoA hydratase